MTSIETKEFRGRYLSQSTEQLLLLKFRGGLIENAITALDSVLNEREVTKALLLKAKNIVDEEQALIENKKARLEKNLETQSIYMGILNKWFF